MSIKIIKSGVLDTLQDAGRIGYADTGINANGAMDVLAMQSANALLGNSLMEAVIELHFPAATFHFETAVLVALCGADFGAQINGIPLATNKTIFVPANSVLHFSHKNWGERCYLAVQGGFDMPGWLGSKSANLKLGMEGFLGRALKKGDALHLNKPAKHLFDRVYVFPWQANLGAWYDAPDIVNILHGPEWDYLQPGSQHDFTATRYEITPNSDRMALQLQGKMLEKIEQQELISSAINFGTIQLPGNGLPIVLMADHQTTGGYPRIAQVIDAHLPKLAQLSAHQKIRFVPTTLAKAENLSLSQHEEMAILQQGILLKLNGLL